MGTAFRSRRRTGHLGRAAVVLAALALLAGCNESDGEGDDGTGSTAAAAETTLASAAAPTAVTAQGFAFVPAELTVAPGTTVRWTNQDGAEHTVVGSGISGSLPAGGGTYEQRFDAVGTFSYACTIHPSMTGTITVA